ncbi:MAG: hypothetical protein KDB26_14415, partial [Microthrixaceae bacterium]|nr:hypothetical protein [Microthrixaceae bacterium]
SSISKDRGQRPAFQFFVKWNDQSDRAFRMFEAIMAAVLADRFPPEPAEHSNEPTSAEGCWW